MQLVKTLALLLTLAGLGYLGWKKSWLLICMFAGSLYFDISRTWFPDFPLVPDGLSLAKLASIVLILTAGWRFCQNKRVRTLAATALRQPLLKALLIFLGVGTVSILVSINRQQTGVEIVRLATMVALLFSIYLLCDKHRVSDIFRVIHWTGVALVPLAVYQGLTKHFLWYQDYATWVPPRVNATFVDPNIFARYLVIAIIANLVLNILHRDIKHRLLYLGTLLCLFIGLWMSYSRSGMVDALLMIVCFVLFIPNKKLRGAAALAALLLAGLIVANPEVLQRFSPLKKGLYALDPGRLYLWNVAWAMFKDHPLWGVGLGAFQRTFEVHYRSMMLAKFWVTRSHTTLLTVAAELGVIGLGVLAWIWICLGRALGKLRRISRETYIIGVGLFLIILSVFFSSQFEARFFEDPVIWLGMALLLVLGRKEPENT